MNFLFLLLTILPLAFTQDDTNTDRRCSGDLSNLWLDVVIVVDNSKGMTVAGITQVAANILTVFGNGTRIGANNTDPRNTRIGIVTYSQDASIVADLNQIQSLDQLGDIVFGPDMAVTDIDSSYLATGLAKAEEVLENGRANNVRWNYQRLVIVYASAYRGTGSLDPIPSSDRLKSSGVTIATVAFAQSGDQALLDGLAKIASPRNAFTSGDPDTVGEIQGTAIQANCFCPNLWTQYSTNAEKLGVCLRAATISASWTAAKFSCQNIFRNGFLATEFDKVKHDFNYNLAKNNTAFQSPLIYHIGLSYTNGGWYWQQPSGFPLKKLSDNSNNTFWNPGYPGSSSNTAVWNQQVDMSIDQIGWKNGNAYTVAEYYICEVASCDTDTYCATLD